MNSSESLRLNKQLALRQGISRRQADDLITQGRVSINGQPAVLGARFQPSDTVMVDNQPLSSSTKLQYLVLNKPLGYVCSRRTQGSSPTIYSLLPPAYHHLKPVGRLDKDSSGLILLTNDGDFAHKMTHPKFHKVKIYEVRLDHNLEPLHQQMISDHGIQLVDGPSKLTLERLSDTNRQAWRVTMHEGRNRQIRRTFTALGYQVTHLHRIQFGNYTLPPSQKPGSFQEILSLQN